VAGDTPHGRPSAPAAPRAARAAPSPCTSRATGGADSSGSCVCTFLCGQSRGDPWPRVWLLPDGSARAPAKAPPAAPGRRHASSLTATALRARGGGGGASPIDTSSVRPPVAAAAALPPRPPGCSIPGRRGVSRRRPRRRHRRRPADSGESEGLRTLWRSTPAVRVVVWAVGGRSTPRRRCRRDGRWGWGGWLPATPPPAR